jgi:hypothetical protein
VGIGLRSYGFWKNRSSVLSASTASPDLVSHSTQTEYLALRSLVTSSHSSAHAKRRPSSMYIPSNELFQFAILPKSGAV